MDEKLFAAPSTATVRRVYRMLPLFSVFLIPFYLCSWGPLPHKQELFLENSLDLRLKIKKQPEEWAENRGISMSAAGAWQHRGKQQLYVVPQAGEVVLLSPPCPVNGNLPAMLHQSGCGNGVCSAPSPEMVRHASSSLLALLDCSPPAF